MHIYIPGEKVWAVLLPCVVVKQLLCSLAMSFKHINQVSPLDLGEFGEKIAVSLDWLSLENIERFLPPLKRWP